MSGQEVASPHETIFAAIATDTVLYTPFLLAYYGGDFHDTPYGHLTVNIIDSKDLRFKQDKNLKGDGFATFCLLFGLADVGICDPSYLVYLKNGNVDISKEFALFEELLEESTKKNLQAEFNGVLEYNNGKLSLKLATAQAVFEDPKIKSYESKVIGNIIKKIAFSAVANSDYYESTNPNSYTSEKFTKREANKLVYQSNVDGKTNIGTKFINDYFDGNFIYYPEPSTGYCIGKLHADIYGKKGEKIRNSDFGYELDTLKEEFNQKAIVLTCDFIALDFLNFIAESKQSNTIDQIGQDNQKNKLARTRQVQDLAEDNENYMFTGILGNSNKDNNNKLQAFLYGIDKNLYIINRFLINNDTLGLTKYLKSKFNLNESNIGELLKLLIAHESIRENILTLIKDNQFTFDEVIDFYVKRLNNWKLYGGLYYSSTIPIAEDLKNMVDIRYMSGEKSNMVDIKDIKNLIVKDLISDWRIEEAKIVRIKKSANNKYSKIQNSLFRFKTALKSPLQILSNNVKTDVETVIWDLISKPLFLYYVGVYFVIFEIIVGIAHLFHLSIPTPSDVPIFIHKNLLFKNIPDIHFNLPMRHANNLLAFYLIIVIIATVFPAYELFRLKSREKFIYRS